MLILYGMDGTGGTAPPAALAKNGKLSEKNKFRYYCFAQADAVVQIGRHIQSVDEMRWPWISVGKICIKRVRRQAKLSDSFA